MTGELKQCPSCGSAYATPEDALTARNRRSDPTDPEGWRDIKSAPRDGTVFVGCILERPSFGSWPMYRRVRHHLTDAGDILTTDLGGWVTIGDVRPDFQEGHDVGPAPEFAVAPDDMNRTVKWGWKPLPTPSGETCAGKETLDQSIPNGGAE